MATGKKYYWIKLKDSFMTSDKVDFLMGLEGGANYIVLYQILCLKTMNTNGELSRKIGEIIMPFDAEKIRRDCKWFSIDTVKTALVYFTQLGMIYRQENGIMKIENFENLCGSETDYARQKRQQRLEKSQKNEQIETTVNVDNTVDSTKDNAMDIVHIDIRDKRLEIRERTNTNTLVQKNESEIDIEELGKTQKNLKEDFEKIWNLYPRKSGKEKSYEYFKRDRGRAKEIYIGVMNFARFCKAINRAQQFIPTGSTFFNQRKWADEYLQSQELLKTEIKKYNSGNQNFKSVRNQNYDDNIDF